MKNSTPWDKYLLLLVGLAVAVFAGLFIAKSLGFVDQFGVDPAKPNNEFPVTSVPRVMAARSFVDKVNEWKLPKKGTGGSEVPLFVSIPIVEIDGKLINMRDPNAPLVRDPVSNGWLMDNNLDYLNKGVLSQDPDGDDFTNLEEWDGKTNPKSADSHPPYVNKLTMLSRKQKSYNLRFAARPDDKRFQILRLPSSSWQKRATFMMKIGETSEDDQFRIDSFEEKTAKRGQINVDASVLNITYLPKQLKIQLVRNIVEPIPTYYVELEFLPAPFPTPEESHVKEGETFTLTNDPKTKYRVIKVEENSATITYETAPGQEKTVEIKKK